MPGPGAGRKLLQKTLYRRQIVAHIKPTGYPADVLLLAPPKQAQFSHRHHIRIAALNAYQSQRLTGRGQVICAQAYLRGQTQLPVA